VTAAPTAAPPGPFVLQNMPVVHLHHQVANIMPGQWPAEFCVDMKLTAPEGNTPERERCIALLGGNKTCGSFFIFINDINEVGMGVRCETGGSNGDSPLLNDDGGLDSNTEHYLQFCYNTHTGNASIWRENQLRVSSKKKWNFERTGFVSVFVGSHVLESQAEGLFEEDKAKLLSLKIQEGFPTPTTTTPPPTTTPDREEVDVSQNGPTDEEARVIDSTMRRRATTTKPWWRHMHHKDTGNLTDIVLNKTVHIIDEITTITTYDGNKTESHAHVVRLKGALVNGSFPHNFTTHSTSSAVSSKVISL
jgi:hypothetical protein